MAANQSSYAPRVVFVAGSTSSTSRSRRVLAALEERARPVVGSTRLHSVRDFPAEALIESDIKAPAIGSFIEDVKSARAIVLATPVYKATYSGALKLLLDVIPPDALVGKAALAIATARQPAHFTTTERGFRDLFEFFRIERVLTPLSLLDEQINTAEPGLALDPVAERALARAVEELGTVR